MKIHEKQASSQPASQAAASINESMIADSQNRAKVSIRAAGCQLGGFQVLELCVTKCMKNIENLENR